MFSRFFFFLRCAFVVVVLSWPAAAQAQQRVSPELAGLVQHAACQASCADLPPDRLILVVFTHEWHLVTDDVSPHPDGSHKGTWLVRGTRQNLSRYYCDYHGRALPFERAHGIFGDGGYTASRFDTRDVWAAVLTPSAVQAEAIPCWSVGHVPSGESIAELVARYGVALATESNVDGTPVLTMVCRLDDRFAWRLELAEHAGRWRLDRAVFLEGDRWRVDVRVEDYGVGVGDMRLPRTIVARQRRLVDNDREDTHRWSLDLSVSGYVDAAQWGATRLTRATVRDEGTGAWSLQELDLPLAPDMSARTSAEKIQETARQEPPAGAKPVPSPSSHGLAMCGVIMLVAAAVLGLKWARRRRTIALCGVLLCAQGCGSGPAVGWHVVPPAHATVTADDAEPRTLTYTLANDSRTPVVITRLVPSCTCSTAAVAESTIPPGGRTTLRVAVHPLGADDTFAQVRIVSEGHPALVASAVVRYNAPLRLEVPTQELSFDAIPWNGTVRRSLTLRADCDGDATIVLADGPPFVTLEAVRDERESGLFRCAVLCTCPPTPREVQTHCSLALVQDTKRRAVVRLAIRARAAALIATDASAVELDNTGRGRISVRSPGPPVVEWRALVGAPDVAVNAAGDGVYVVEIAASTKPIRGTVLIMPAADLCPAEVRQRHAVPVLVCDSR